MIEINDKKIYYPLKYKPTKIQIDALDFIKKSINNGKKFILLNMPTGSGKSYLIAGMFANWYRNFITKDAKFDILTESKILQDQYANDFDYISIYKGKSNYYCNPYGCQCDIAKEQCKDKKPSCYNTTCPYDVARNKWINSSIGLTNFHLFNALSLYQKDIIDSRNSNVLIIDEAHLYEENFSNYLSFNISAKILKNCGFESGEIIHLDDRYISKIKTVENFMKFISEKLSNDLERKKIIFESKVEHTKNKEKITLLGYINRINHKLESINHIMDSYKNDSENIVLDLNIDKFEKMYSGVELNIQCIWINEYISDIWKKYDHVIFMSATILEKNIFSFINGIDENLTSYYDVPSPFDIKNRKIYYMKIGKMNYNSKTETFQKMIPWINKILEKYKDKKGIIHTTNYEIAEWIKENIQNSRLLFHNNKDRNEILERHLNTSDPTVLVSPSMMTGVDLANNLSRFQIILKVPYPNLSSNKIKNRQKSKPEYYTLKTLNDIIQAYGRSVRNINDYADTYILDENFSDLLKYNSHMMPKYFIDAIKNLK